MGMILRIASSRIVGQGDIVGRSGYFSLNLSANSVMRGRLDARRTLKSLVADLREKKDMAVFRGKVTDKEQRIKFMKMYFGHPMCDLGDISRDTINPTWCIGKLTIKEQLEYKFVLAIEGYDVASNLKWVMSSNSIAVMPRPTCETWFMEGTLIPNYHYIEIKPDFSDLEERLQYYMAHTDEAQAIIEHAHEYIEQFKNKKREQLISLLVLEKYFKMTGQFNH